MFVKKWMEGLNLKEIAISVHLSTDLVIYDVFVCVTLQKIPIEITSESTEPSKREVCDKSNIMNMLSDLQYDGDGTTVQCIGVTRHTVEHESALLRLRPHG